ncbi:MAG: CTP synthase [Treponema sp.]|jgi:CTP synthase|nr:CTP synthase [Treponema sp.]
MKKFIFVTGGVCSSLGKGVAASSLGALLEARGLNVRMLKCDPYINMNAGRLSPAQHGEVYVTDDGAETDLDFGNYDRFTSGPLSKANSITTGQVYEAVINREKNGQYGGNTVQVIPHITNEIKSRILAVSKEYPDTDIVIIEIGGTVGDIELIPFLETARQLIHEQGRENALSVHLTLVPKVGEDEQELKTKPTQHSVKAMQEWGIQPDILICRAPTMLGEGIRRKIAQFTNVDIESIFTSYNVKTTVYQLPRIFHDQNLDSIVLKKLGVEANQADLKDWDSVMEKYKSRKGKIRVGFVGKYVGASDAYKSIEEALFHAGLACGVKVEYERINALKLEQEEDGVEKYLGGGGVTIDGAAQDEASGRAVDAVLVPSSSGQSGVLGMMKAAEWARKNNVPFFGRCVGMQIMAMEWARNVIGWSDADSSEFDSESQHFVISRLDEQTDVKIYGESRRIGKSESSLVEGSKIYTAYGTTQIAERHRHKFEFSNKYRKDMTDSGLIISATTPDESLVDAIEWPDHPWGVGVQFDPEFTSKPNAANPLFRDFVAAAKQRAGI